MSSQGPLHGVCVPSASPEKSESNPYQSEARLTDFTSQVSREPVPEPPRCHAYWVASLVLTGVALVMTVGSIVMVGVLFKVIDDAPGEALGYLVTIILYILTLVESALCLIAMITCVVLLACRPRAVLIRDPNHGGFICLCASVFILFLLAGYSFAVPIIVRTQKPNTSAALCIIPGVRAIALLSFFAVLVANSKL